MSLEINITDFFYSECPSDYCASRAEIGDNADQDTWQAANECECSFITDDTREEVRAHFASLVAGCGENIASWPDSELNALLIQDISGNMRDFLCGFGLFADAWDWDTYEASIPARNDENTSDRLFKGDDNEVYFLIG